MLCSYPPIYIFFNEILLKVDKPCSLMKVHYPGLMVIEYKPLFFFFFFFFYHLALFLVCVSLINWTGLLVDGHPEVHFIALLFCLESRRTYCNLKYVFLWCLIQICIGWEYSGSILSAYNHSSIYSTLSPILISYVTCDTFSLWFCRVFLVCKKNGGSWLPSAFEKQFSKCLLKSSWQSESDYFLVTDWYRPYWSGITRV